MLGLALLYDFAMDFMLWIVLPTVSVLIVARFLVSGPLAQRILAWISGVAASLFAVLSLAAIVLAIKGLDDNPYLEGHERAEMRDLSNRFSVFCLLAAGVLTTAAGTLGWITRSLFRGVRQMKEV